MRIASLAALAAFALLSGCLSTPSAAPAAHAETAPGSAATPAPAAADGPRSVTEAFAVNGTTGTTLCADYTTPALRCAIVRADIQPTIPVDHPVTDIYYSKQVARQLLPSTLTTTWSAATPATQVLRAQAMVVSNCKDTCDVIRMLAEATGPSPLALDIPATALEPSQSIGFAVSGTLAGQEPPKSDIYLAQAFHAEGAFSFLA